MASQVIYHFMPFAYTSGTFAKLPLHFSVRSRNSCKLQSLFTDSVAVSASIAAFLELFLFAGGCRHNEQCVIDMLWQHLVFNGNCSKMAAAVAKMSTVSVNKVVILVSSYSVY